MHARPAHATHIAAGNTLYISGSVSWGAAGTVIGAGDMQAQVGAVYTDLKETLAAHGATFKNVLKENVFTTDMDALEANDDLRIKFYIDDECSRELRSRATCEIALLPYHSRIPRSTVGEYCRKDGWRIYGVFKKQGDWISYVATRGNNPPAPRND